MLRFVFMLGSAIILATMLAGCVATGPYYYQPYYHPYYYHPYYHYYGGYYGSYYNHCWRCW